jgi:hypothetical protein
VLAKRRPLRYGGFVRSILPAGGLALAAVLAASLGPAAQVEPMRPQAPQEVRILRPDVVQSVDAVTLDGSAQQVQAAEPASAVKRVASTAGKVVLGVTAAGVAVGAAILSLLFL